MNSLFLQQLVCFLQVAKLKKVDFVCERSKMIKMDLLSIEEEASEDIRPAPQHHHE